jgi:hypothetical protein
MVGRLLECKARALEVARGVRRMSDRDPIVQLVWDLERDGRPSLAWVVRWSAGGAEPVAAAWSASRAPLHMAKLLERVGWPSPVAVPWERASARAALRLVRGEGPAATLDAALTEYALVREEHYAALADRIRRAVPQPPTLAQLVAARRSGRG